MTLRGHRVLVYDMDAAEWRARLGESQAAARIGVSPGLVAEV
jgi:hypothetical protein